MKWSDDRTLHITKEDITAIEVLEALQGWLKANDEKMTVYLCILDEELYTMAVNWLNEQE